VHAQERNISIAALVSEDERAAVELAANHIADSLTRAAGIPWTCHCTFRSDLEGLQDAGTATIVLTSLLRELGDAETPWPATEQRLRARYATLCAREHPVLLCTIFRHVNADTDADVAAALRARIRRLDLLAAEISHETGAYVIDLDRVLADIGGRRLDTDYRLSGPGGSAVAAHTIALSIVGNALDAIVSFELSDAATAILESDRSAIAAYGVKRDLALQPLQSMGHKRRRQIIAPVTYSVPSQHAAWVVRNVLRGRIGPAEACRRLIGAVRARGLRGCAALLGAALLRQIERKR